MDLTRHILRLTFEQGTLLLDTSNPAPLKEFKIPITWDSRVSLWRCDPLHYAPLLEELRLAGYQVADNVPRWQEVIWPEIALPVLRKEQQKACHDWLKTKRGVIVMPTGTGKTEVALAIMRDLTVSTLVVVPVRDLMYQWHSRIQQGMGYEAGLIGDNTYRVKMAAINTWIC